MGLIALMLQGEGTFASRPASLDDELFAAVKGRASALRVRGDDCIAQGIGIERAGGPELGAINTALVQPAHLLIVGGAR